MKKLNNITRPDQGGNPSGLLKLRLLHARDVLGLADPRYLISSAQGVSLPPGGLTLAMGAELVDVYTAPDQLVYTEQLQTINRSKRWAQTVALSIPEVSADRMEAAAVLSKGRWLAVVMDANERCRLVGRPDQPLICNVVQVDPANCTIRLEGVTPGPAFFVPDISKAGLLGEPADFSFNFSFDFNA